MFKDSGTYPPVDLGSFIESEFWDELFRVSSTMVPDHMGEEFDNADFVFIKELVAGNIQGAYRTLCDRYELTGHSIDHSGRWFSGDEIGVVALGQCLEFAEYWGIDDPNLPSMREDYDLLAFIYDFENPGPDEAELLEMLRTDK